MLAVFEMNVTCSKSPTFIDVIFHNQYMSTFVIPINLLIALNHFSDMSDIKFYCSDSLNIWKHLQDILPKIVLK